MSRNRVVGGFEDAFESAQSNVATAVKQTAKDFTATTKGQITGGSTTSSSAAHGQQPSHGGNDHGTNEAATGGPQHSDPAANQKSDQERIDFLRDLYGKSDHNENSSSTYSDGSKSDLVKGALGMSEDPNKNLSPEEKMKLEALRARLHNEKYYQPLINRPKQKEEPVVEKLEREEQMEVIEEQKKQEKKPGPLQNVKQGTGESVVGVSG
jgi:hypothetical protein